MNFPNQFIAATKEYGTFASPVPAPYLRKTIVAEKDETAEILITACGFYRLYWNGQEITKGLIAPYVSNPNDMVYYDRYTVSLKQGENVLALCLGNGFQNNEGGYIWGFDNAPFRSAPKVAFSVTWQGGQVVSDTTVKTAPSPIVFDDYRFGVHYDATKEIHGWNLPDFDDSDWVNAIPAAAPAGEKRLCQANPIVYGEEIKPVAITPMEDGSYLYDFGVNHTGVCRLTVQGEKGQSISWQHGETLIDGKMDVTCVWFAREQTPRDLKIVHKDCYVCKGEGTETYTPTFTYHGFRYVTVRGITKEQATPELLTFCTLHSDLAVCGGFTTSHPTVQTLYDITRRSVISNFHYFPTDCPHREKNGWTADAALSAEQTLLQFAAHGEYKEWLRNIVKAQDERGALPGIVPTAGWGFAWGNGPAWDSVLIYLPWFVYRYRGDLSLTTEAADAMIRYFNYLDTRKDARGLLAIGLGDWCHTGFDNSGAPKAPLVVTDSIVAMDLAAKAEFLFLEANLTQQAGVAHVFRENMRTAIRTHLVDFDTMTVHGNCQSCQTMALFYGVFDPEIPAESDGAFARLLELIEEADGKMDVGVLGGRVLFHVLSGRGETDLALSMILGPDFPSYGYWLEQGATTLWEAFDKTIIRSRNHHFWGDISSWFVQHLAGICYNPAVNDHKHIIFAPNFASVLEDAAAYFDSNYGRVEAAWQRQEDGIRYTVTLPKDCHGVIRLPEGYAFENGESICQAQNGDYVVIKK
ncbi:MAG: family 78 glycoside hydrolase catalytic domain [Clostridia bacterium]|nr:family 78 glycoside hydrolase catalytic domain [Clostridia bacterium]